MKDTKVNIFIGPITGKARILSFENGHLGRHIRTGGGFHPTSGPTYGGNSIREAIGFLKTHYVVRELHKSEIPDTYAQEVNRGKWFQIKGEK